MKNPPFMCGKSSIKIPQRSQALRPKIPPFTYGNPPVEISHPIPPPTNPPHYLRNYRKLLKMCGLSAKSRVIVQVDRRTLKAVFSVLVVFSENIHFANISKNIPIIEGLLVPEEGWLDTSLGKMHSLLRIS